MKDIEIFRYAGGIRLVKNKARHLSPVGDVVDAVVGVKTDRSLLERDDARRQRQPEVVDVVGNKKLVVREMLLRPELLLSGVGQDQLNALGAIPKS